MKTGIIYRIWNTINNKTYIGKSYRSLEDRLADHISDSKRYTNRPLYRAFAKYGIESFSAEILGIYQEDILEQKEIEYIKLYDSYGNKGYNATLGGEGTKLISIDNELLIETYNKYGSIVATARQLKIDEETCSRLLKGISGFEFKTKSQISRKGIKPVLLEDLNISFKDVYECANFLIDSDVSNITDEVQVAKSIRKVCTGHSKKYLGLKFSYIEFALLA